MTTIIVTHTSPDWDAIASCWLVERFVNRFGDFTDCEVQFVNTGTPDPALLAAAHAVVDTGRVYDPARMRFDHHQLDGAAANATCAAQQVYAWLCESRPDLAYLQSIIDLIYHGDTGKSDANLSRSVGIHALLSVRKARRESDRDLLAWGYGVLDDLASHAKAQADARASLAQHTVYRSTDGLVVALEGAPQGATYAAFDAGARMVVFYSVLPDTVSVGVMRGGENQDVHVGDVVASAMAQADAPLRTEFTRWFRHPAGFFAGRGTAKAPDPTPLPVSVATIAAVLDAAWLRP